MTLLKKQIRAIPQEIINQRAAQGKDLIGLLEEQIRAIPQEIINQRATKGKDLSHLSEEQISAIPQKSINMLAATSRYSSDLSEKRIAEIPKVITEISRESIEALILYGSGKIKKEDLPANIFLNRHLRAALLKIIDVRLIKQYNKICKDHGYVDYVPDKVKKSFDKKVQENIVRANNDSGDPGHSVVSNKLKLAANKPEQVPVFDQSFNLTDVSNNVALGDVFAIGSGKTQKLYVNQNGAAIELKISKDKFEELFPPKGFALAEQNG